MIGTTRLSPLLLCICLAPIFKLCFQGVLLNIWIRQNVCSLPTFAKPNNFPKNSRKIFLMSQLAESKPPVGTAVIGLIFEFIPPIKRPGVVYNTPRSACPKYKYCYDWLFKYTSNDYPKTLSCIPFTIWLVTLNTIFKHLRIVSWINFYKSSYWKLVNNYQWKGGQCRRAGRGSSSPPVLQPVAWSKCKSWGVGASPWTYRTQLHCINHFNAKSIHILFRKRILNLLF